ncbi:hypothetical protein NliqN6_5983 [Naganishia liquefaciens]|uniref:Uncharacterized protein n=1 Tax=Naganishia liquefaciens TaxID=104408 RepID=A0A8H3TXU2_9TREE|nr:hypothetical protein NliqN6_5983 [Naganishia liquefaciens]
MQPWAESECEGRWMLVEKYTSPFSPSSGLQGESRLGWASVDGQGKWLSYGDIDFIELPNGDLIKLQMRRVSHSEDSTAAEYALELGICGLLGGEPLPDCQWLLNIPNDQHGPGMYVGYVAELFKEHAKQLKDAGWDDSKVRQAVTGRIESLQESVISREGTRPVRWSEAILAFKGIPCD